MKKCAVDGCEKPKDGGHRFCCTHYSRWRKYKDVNVVHVRGPNKKYKNRKCDVPGCENKHCAIRLCNKHYRQILTISEKHFNLSPLVK